MRDRDQLGLRRQQLRQLVQLQLAAIVDRQHAQLGALLLAQHLPGHDVGVMLHRGDQDFIAGADVLAAIALRDQVDGLGRAAHKDDLALVGGIQKALHRAPRRFVLLGRVLGEIVHAAMNVGVVALVVMRDGVDHRPRLLRGRGVVEVHQRMPVHLLLQNGKIAANRLDIVTLASAERWTRLNGQAVCGRGHPTSSQFLPLSSTFARRAIGRVCAIANRWLLISPSM